MHPSIMLPIVQMVVNVAHVATGQREKRVVPVGVYTHADSERFIFSGLSNHRGRYLHARPRY